eukprot:7530071-Pyramimonas_sp.AAC.1
MSWRVLRKPTVLAARAGSCFGEHFARFICPFPLAFTCLLATTFTRIPASRGTPPAQHRSHLHGRSQLARWFSGTAKTYQPLSAPL